MSEVQDVKRLLYPVIKRLPLIVIFFISAIVAAWRLTAYQTPTYEAKSIIKLDDHKEGFSDNNLYKDLDIFSATNDVLTELEMIKSDVILLRALEMMPTDIVYHRVGKLKTTELYDDTPFLVEVDTATFEHYNKLFNIRILDQKKFLWIKGLDSTVHQFGEKIVLDDSDFVKINFNKDYLIEHDPATIVGDFQFRVCTKQYLLSNFVNNNLFVKEIDKNIRIIKIYFEGEHPKRVSDYANAVAKSYLQDHTLVKTHAADLTESFLNERITEARDSLMKAEYNLEQYRLNNRVINLKQETETDLRHISQLKVQMTNLKMKMVVLDSLQAYVKHDREKFLESAPGFSAYGGLIFTEMIKQMKAFQLERIDLLNHYTPESKEVQTVNQKMDNLVDYIIENIHNHRQNTNEQLKELGHDLAKAESKLDNLPSTEKDIIQLEQEFKHYYDLHNFLKKKKMEAGIAKRANFYFHRIIKEATPATMPSSPNRSFNVALAGFLSLLLSIALVYIISAATGKISSRHQIEKMTDAPVIGVIKKNAVKDINCSLDFFISNLIPMMNKKKGVRIAISSSIAKEGKSYLSHATARSLAKAGRKVLLIDLNACCGQWQQLSAEDPDGKTLNDYFNHKIKLDNVYHTTELDNLTVCGFDPDAPLKSYFLEAGFDDKFNALCDNFDIVLFDCPAYSIAPEAAIYMRHSDFKIFVMRYGYTSTKFVSNVNRLIDTYGKDSVGIAINQAPQGMNYSGRFFGSRFMYHQPKGIIGRLKHYWESYGKSWNI